MYTCAAAFDRDPPGWVRLVYPLFVLSAAGRCGRLPGARGRCASGARAATCPYPGRRTIWRDAAMY